MSNAVLAGIVSVKGDFAEETQPLPDGLLSGTSENIRRTVTETCCAVMTDECKRIIGS